MTVHAISDAFASRRAGRTTAVMTVALFLGALTVMLDLSRVNVALPTIGRELHTDLAGLQWIVDAYYLSLASLLLVGGMISDRLGVRPSFLGSLVVFLIGSTVSSVASTLPTLVVGRAIQGMAGAVFVPASLSLIVHLFPDQAARTRALGVWSSINGLAVAGGPVLGGWLAHTFGWHSIFLINLPVGVAVLAIAGAALKVPGAATRGPLDILGPLLGMAWIGPLIYALIEGNRQGWISPLILGLLGVSAACFLLFLWVERSGPRRMLPLAMFRNRTFSAVNLVALAIGFGPFAAIVFIALYLQLVVGFSPLIAGLAYLPVAIAMITAAPLAGRLVAKRGPWLPMAIGLLLLAASLLALASLGPDSAYLSFWWMFLIFGLGLGLALPPTNAIALGAFPPERSGTAGATINATLQLGLALGVGGLGAIVSARLRAGLYERLIQRGLPEDLRNQIVAAIASGRDASGIGALAPNSLHRMSVEAWAYGVRGAFVVAALAVLAGSLGLLLIRVRSDP